MTEQLVQSGRLQEKFCAQMPLIGDKAPAFEAETTKGMIRFPDDYAGKWVILFSHPADFTPVCTSELFTFAKMTEEFREMDAELVGLSVDSVSSHLAWLKSIEEEIRFHGEQNVKIDYPVIADVKMAVARKYGMIHPSVSDTKAVRAVFLIDPEAKIRAILYYPLSTGRNFQEIKRLLAALQVTDKYQVSTPVRLAAGRRCGGFGTDDAERGYERENKQDGCDCGTWYFCTKKFPSRRINLRSPLKNDANRCVI